MCTYGEYQSISLANDDFRVNNAREILATLRRIAQEKEQVYLLGDNGEYSLMSAILAIDEEEQAFYLDCSANEALNESLVNSSRVVCESRLNQVMIRFEVESLERVQREDSAAFKMAIPQALLHMEHREFHRVHIPLSRHIPCKLRQDIEGELVDISSGGMCIQLSNNSSLSLKEGESYEAKLEIAAGDWVDVKFTVQRTWQELTQRGEMKKHAGCQFGTLSVRAQSLIDRLILKLQVESIAQSRH